MRWGPEIISACLSTVSAVYGLFYGIDLAKEEKWVILKEINQIQENFRFPEKGFTHLIDLHLYLKALFLFA